MQENDELDGLRAKIQHLQTEYDWVRAKNERLTELAEAWRQIALGYAVVQRLEG